MATPCSIRLWGYGLAGKSTEVGKKNCLGNEHLFNPKASNQEWSNQEWSNQESCNQESSNQESNNKE